MVVADLIGTATSVFVNFSVDSWMFTAAGAFFKNKLLRIMNVILNGAGTFNGIFFLHKNEK